MRERYAGFQSGDGVGAQVDAAVAKRFVIPLADGSVDVAVVAVESEVRRNYADDFVGRAIQSDGFSEDIERSAELRVSRRLRPESRPAPHRRDRHRREKCGREWELHRAWRKKSAEIMISGDAFRFAGSREVAIVIAIHGHGGKSLRVALPVEKIQISDWALLGAGSASVNRDELAGVRVGERVEKDAVDY